MIVRKAVGDLDQILAIARNGSVCVKDFEPATLRGAVEQVLALDPAKRATIRANSGEFTLEAGVDKYDAIYRRLLGGGGTKSAIDGSRVAGQNIGGNNRC